MPINKVVYGETTIIDLTDSTLSEASELAAGVTAYDRTGTLITGTATLGSEWTSGIYLDEDGYIRVSPLAGAGGIALQDGYLIFGSTEMSAFPDGDEIGYGVSDEGYVGAAAVGVARVMRESETPTADIVGSGTADSMTLQS